MDFVIVWIAIYAVISMQVAVVALYINYLIRSLYRYGKIHWTMLVYGAIIAFLIVVNCLLIGSIHSMLYEQKNIHPQRIRFQKRETPVLVDPPRKHLDELYETEMKRIEQERQKTIEQFEKLEIRKR